MRVACFCGRYFETPGRAAICPGCFEEISVPVTADVIREDMERELAELIAEHEA